MKLSDLSGDEVTLVSGSKSLKMSSLKPEDIQLVQAAPSDNFDPKAAIQGFGQFATSGYLPELTGLAGKFIPDPNAGVDAQLRAKGTNIQQQPFQGTTTDESRALQQKLAHDSPYSYYGGGIGGAIASAPAYGAALKGIGIAKEVPAAAQVASDASFLTKAGAYASNLGSRMAQAGKEGLALGFASNPNSNPGDDGFNLGKRVVNAGTTGAVSAAIPPAVDAIKGAWEGGKAATKWAGTKFLSSLGGVKPDVIREYTQFSDRINKAPSVEALKGISDEFTGKLSADVDAKKISAEQAQDAYKAFQSDLKEAYRSSSYDARDAVTSAKQTLKDAHNTRIQQLSGDIYHTVNQLKSDVQAGSAQALKTLDNSSAMIDLAPTYSKIDGTIERLQKAGTDEALGVADKLQAYKDRLIAKHGTNIPAVDAKRLLQGLDQTTTYSPMAGSFDQTKNAAFKGIRGSLDETVKGSVDQYKQQMSKVATDTDLLSRVSDFGDRQTGAGILGGIHSPRRMDHRAALQELGQKYGADFVGAAHPESLPEHELLNKAIGAKESLRPDRISEKMEQTLAGSRQKVQLDASQSALTQAQDNLAPFKSLSPNSAGQTQVQQKLMQLGQGKNIELEGMFEKLGKLTDTDFVQAMKDQNTLAAFQKGATNGSRNTLIGSLIGFLFGGLPGAAGGAAAGRVVDQWGPAITKKVLDGAIYVSKSPSIKTISELSLPEPIKRNMIIGLQNYELNNSKFIQPAARKVASIDEPAKGEDSWARQGIQKLGIQDQQLAGQLFQDPKARQLLIQASDLKPGSKAMKNIMNQLQKGWSNP